MSRRRVERYGRLHEHPEDLPGAKAICCAISHDSMMLNSEIVSFFTHERPMSCVATDLATLSSPPLSAYLIC
jgi:hypothetical protein